MLFFLSHIFVSLSFQKNDSFSSSVSKYLIINGSIVFLFSRTITVIFLKIWCVSDIENICYIFFLISSFFCFYSFFLERKYKKKNDFLILAKFMLNLIYCWGCFLLFLGSLIKSLNFTGLLSMFLISSFLFILASFYFKNDKFQLTLNIGAKDIELYNNIRLFIHAIESRKINRQSIMDILGYSYNKTNTSQFQKIKSLTGLERILEKTKDTTVDDSDIDYLLYQHIDFLFKESLNIYKDSPVLLVNYAIFQIEKLKKYQKSYNTLIKASELSRLSFTEEFCIYRIKRNLEERGIEMGVEETHISYAFQTKQILCLIQEISQLYTQFWNILLNKNERIDVNHLKDLGVKIDELRQSIKEKFKNLVSNGLNTKRISILYQNFIKDVLNDSQDILENNHDFENDEKLQKSFNDINQLQPKSNFQFIVIYGYGEYFGLIKKISLGICQLLGYSEKDLVDHSINLIIPDFIRQSHEKMLKIKIKYSTPQYNSFNTLKESFVLFRNSAKFLVPVFVKNGIIFDENNQPMIFLQLNDKQERKNENKYRKCYILINNDLLIQNFTPNCLSSLGFESYFLNGSYEITQFIPDFNSEVSHALNNIPNEEEHKELKIKIFKDLLISNNGKDKVVINWKNSKKFLCLIQEFKILSETTGFWIELESTEHLLETLSICKSYTKSYTNSHSKKNSKTNKSRKSLIHILQSKDMETNFISQNYIPSVEKKFVFDIKAKTFFIKNEDENYENEIYSIKHFFEKKYEDNLDANNNKEKSSFESSLKKSSSSNTSSSDSSYLSGNSKYEDDNVYDNKVNENLMIDQEISYQNYYKVKTNRIIYSIYDFNNHLLKEVKKKNFESQVEEIMIGERAVTKRVSFVSDGKDNKEAEYRYSLIKNKNVDSRIEKKSSQTESQNSLINKLISPHLINKSIISLIMYYLLSLVILIVVPYITFTKILNSSKQIYILSSFVHVQCSLSEQIILAYYYLSEFIFLKNPKYNCSYINNRTEYSYFVQEKLKTIYHETEQHLDKFIIHKVAISKKGQRIIDTSYLNITFYYYDKEYSFNHRIYELLLTPSIQMYVYNYFSFIHLNENKQHFLNHRVQYNMDNYQKIADGIREFNKFYLEEIEEISKSNKSLLWSIFVVYFFFEIIVTLLCILGKTKSVREKEKYLNLFYKIDIEVVKMMGLKCQKYSNIQIDKKSLSQNHEFMNSDEDDNDIEDLLSKKETHNNKLIQSKKGGLSIFNKEQIIKNKEFKSLLFLNLIVHGSLIIIVLSSIIKTLSSFIKFYNSALINILCMEQEQYFFYNINKLRLHIRNSGLYLYQGEKLEDINKRINDAKNIFLRLKQLELYIYGNITEKGLPGNVSIIIINSLTEGLCYFYDGLFNLSNLTCEEIGNNVVDYGLIPIHSFYIKVFFELLNDFEDVLNYAFKKGYIYTDFAYGSELYNLSIPDGVEEEDYLKSNPFLFVNYKGFRDITLIIVDILVPMYRNIIGLLFDSFEEFYINNHDFIYILMIVFYLIIIFIYIFHIFPMIFHENRDINKTRTILSVIPKTVLYEIIKNDNLEERIEKNI